MNPGRGQRHGPEGLVAASARLGVWAGRLFVWPGRALYLGDAADTTLHAHHAIQLCIAIAGSFRLRSSARGRWVQHREAVVPADSEHQLDGRGALLALVYLEPEAEPGRQLMALPRTKSFGLKEERILNRVRDRLASLAGSQDGEREAGAAIDDVLTGLMPNYVPCGGLDARVVDLLEHLAGLSDPRMSAADAAATVGLSSHRFQHLFRTNTGIPFRRYLLWLRLVAAVGHVARGGTLTDAAHDAGFSDSAHLSRTFRRMFGLSPSELARGSTFVQASARRVS